MSIRAVVDIVTDLICTGKDASKQFWKYHNESVLKKYSPKLKIGEVKEEAKL